MYQAGSELQPPGTDWLIAGRSVNLTVCPSNLIRAANARARVLHKSPINDSSGESLAHSTLNGEHQRATMKFLAIVLLAASACATEIEKRDAEPSVVSYGHHRPSYGYGYGHPYDHLGYYPLGYGYVHPHHKRSADPEPEAEASLSYAHPHGHPHPHVYHPHGHHYGKRSADPQPDFAYSYPRPSYYYDPTYYGYGYGYH
ncbi:uncharacterized protein [Palaemon carinicauda]|uniref:uncharacterized protein n=1 Tax=Palaemon carinicauda TaxID=392227 RepID=UPI0035B58EFC